MQCTVYGSLSARLRMATDKSFSFGTSGHEYLSLPSYPAIRFSKG